jgi:ketosteroid isomerase-like protein
MSQENVELVRGLQPTPDTDLVTVFRDEVAFAALTAAVSPFLHEDFEVVAPTLVAGQDARLVGLDGLRAVWLEWLDPWKSYRVEIEGMIDAGDEAVVLYRDYGRRDGMAAEVSVRGGTVWTVLDGKVARVAFYIDRREALEAVGLSEQDAQADS